MIISSIGFQKQSLLIILPALDFTIFSGLYRRSVLRHQSNKRKVNPEELDELFDQFVEGNSCISLRITWILSYFLLFSRLEMRCHSNQMWTALSFCSKELYQKLKCKRKYRNIEIPWFLKHLP